MTDRFYDTKEGIRDSLQTLVAFNHLIRERSRAGYQRHEKLQSFVVLGRWWFDTCGNTGRARDWIPKIHIPQMPDVMTMDEFRTMLQEYDFYTKPDLLTDEELEADPKLYSSGRSFSTSVAWGMDGSGVPPAHVECPICHEKWTMQNCHDAMSVRSTHKQEEDGFVINDKTIEEIKAYFSGRSDAEFFIHPEVYHADKSRSKPDDSYVIQEDDDLMITRFAYYHFVCMEIMLANRELDHFKKIFENAGLAATFTPVPNQYCGNKYCCPPWFEAKTPVGTFTIGWRKRVINIEFESLDIAGLFPDENVTKGKDHIHAWGEEKATEYLKKIRDAAYDKESALQLHSVA